VTGFLQELPIKNKVETNRNKSIMTSMETRNFTDTQTGAHDCHK
jgi:hypothetical protein